MQLVKNSRLFGLLNATSLLTFLKNTGAFPQSCSVTLFFKEDTCDGEPFVVRLWAKSSNLTNKIFVGDFPHLWTAASPNDKFHQFKYCNCPNFFRIFFERTPLGDFLCTWCLQWCDLSHTLSTSSGDYISFKKTVRLYIFM